MTPSAVLNGVVVQHSEMVGITGRVFGMKRREECAGQYHSFGHGRRRSSSKGFRLQTQFLTCRVFSMHSQSSSEMHMSFAILEVGLIFSRVRLMCILFNYRKSLFRYKSFSF